MLDAAGRIGACDLLLLTLDTLRYDVAVACLRAGRTPCLAGVLPPGGWEERHSPGRFTYSAHHAFFADARTARQTRAPVRVALPGQRDDRPAHLCPRRA
jgi:hypothetical protein